MTDEKQTPKKPRAVATVPRDLPVTKASDGLVFDHVEVLEKRVKRLEDVLRNAGLM